MISYIYKELTQLHTRKKNNANKKHTKDLDGHFSKKDIEGPKTYRKMLSITSHQRDANYNLS